MSHGFASIMENNKKAQSINISDVKISFIGLGYVGLPLAVEFCKKFRIAGFDIKSSRVEEMRAGKDSAWEVEPAELREAKPLKYTSDIDDLRSCDIHIVIVPTPIDKYKRPDLSPLLKNSKALGEIIKKGDIIIYESTVYRGCMEDDCVPVLEKYSGEALKNRRQPLHSLSIGRRKSDLR